MTQEELDLMLRKHDSLPIARAVLPKGATAVGRLAKAPARGAYWLERGLGQKAGLFLAPTESLTPLGPWARTWREVEAAVLPACRKPDVWKAELEAGNRGEHPSPEVVSALWAGFSLGAAVCLGCDLIGHWRGREAPSWGGWEALPDVEDGGRGSVQFWLRLARYPDGSARPADGKAEPQFNVPRGAVAFLLRCGLVQPDAVRMESAPACCGNKLFRCAYAPGDGCGAAGESLLAAVPLALVVAMLERGGAS